MVETTMPPSCHPRRLPTGMPQKRRCSQPVKRARPFSDAPRLLLTLREATEHDVGFLSEATMGSVTEDLSSLEIAIAQDTTQAAQQLKTRVDALQSRGLRPIAVHGIERFIDAGKAAEFVQLNRRTLLRLAREGSIPAHPLTGTKRRKWRFLISELDAWARAKVNSTSDRCQNSRSE